MDKFDTDHRTDTARPKIWISALFVLTLLYLWISISPFESLSQEPVPRAALNQLFGAVLFAIVLVVVFAQGSQRLILQPRITIFICFAWLAFCSVFAASPITALQRLLFTFLITVMMSALLLMPNSKAQFSRLLAAFSLILLALCYFGVVVWPSQSVHQAYDIAEPQLAGDWRGVFNHKNYAAPAMIIICLFGLYLRKTWSQIGGIAIALLAVIFLYKTNGKTATMLLPLTLFTCFWLERAPRLVPMMSLLLLGLLSAIVVGSSFSPSIREFVDSLGIDSTFTGRTDIWQLSMETFVQSPFIGQGFQSFWNTEALTSQKDFAGTWAIAASHAHNGYIEALLNGGIPALVFTIIWLVIQPAINYSKAQKMRRDCDLNRLFFRVWLYSIMAACLESSFYIGNGALWPSTLLAVFGLKMQASATLK